MNLPERVAPQISLYPVDCRHTHQLLASYIVYKNRATLAAESSKTNAAARASNCFFLLVWYAAAVP